MLKINENEVLLSKKDLRVLIGAAAVKTVVTLDSYNATKNLKDLFMVCASNMYGEIEDLIWEEEKIPDIVVDAAKKMIHIEDDPDEAPKASCEDKHSICSLLLAALQRTRAYHDLENLLYDPVSEKVLAEYAGGGSRQINTECDSGIAMINDIMAHI